MEDVTYALWSEFLEPCEQILTAHHETLDSGLMLHVTLKPGGYKGHLIVTIQSGVTTTFQTEWKKDLTRFPSRIKAAATALRNCGRIGKFEISHDDGELSIHKVIHERPNE